MATKTLSVGGVIGLLKETFTDWMEDNCLRLSAALAYYSIFSIAPLLVIAISLAGMFFDAAAARGEIEKQMTGYVGAEAAKAVQAMVESASKPTTSKVAAFVGVVTLLFGASGVFGQLKDALNTIWEVKLKPGGGVKAFIKERLLSFGMVLVIGFLLLVSLLLTTTLAAVSGYFEHLLKLPASIWGTISFLGSFAVVTALFATIFKVLPDAQVQWRNVWIGAVVTALLFEIGKFGLGWYLGRESTASTYGAAASVVLLLLWVYYAALILFFGAEFTQVYARATGADIQPAKNAEPVTTGERVQEGLPTRNADTPQPPREHLTPPPPPRERLSAPRPVSMNPLALAAAAGLGAGFVVSWHQRRKTAPGSLLQRGVERVTRAAQARL